MLLERILRKRYQARKVCKDNDNRLEDRTKPDISIVVNEFRFIWILESLEILISIGTKRIKMVTRSKLFRLQSVRTLTIHQKSREFLEEFRVNFETIYEEIGYMISTSQTHRAELMYRKKVVQRGKNIAKSMSRNPVPTALPPQQTVIHEKGMMMFYWIKINQKTQLYQQMYLLCSIFQAKQLTTKQYGICSKMLLVDTKQYEYCLKSKQLNRININKEIQLSTFTNTVFIYNDIVTKSNILLNVNTMNTFAVFGLNDNNQQISDSLINVTVMYDIIYGSLICIKCDITLKNSNLLYEAGGSQISTLMQESLHYIIVVNSSIQFRFDAITCGGLVYKLSEANLLFSILNTALIGFNFQDNINNGNIISYLSITQIVDVQQLYLCSNIVNHIGVHSSISIIFLSQPIITCNLCNASQIPVYGKCANGLINGKINSDGVYVCFYPFFFNNSQCSCSFGYLLNNSQCINLFEELTNINVQLQQLQQYQLDISLQIEHNFIDISNDIKDSKYLFMTKISEINSSMMLQQYTSNQKLDNINQTLLQQTNITNFNIQAINSSLYNEIQYLQMQVSRQQNNITSQQQQIQELTQIINQIQKTTFSVTEIQWEHSHCSPQYKLCFNGVCVNVIGTGVCNFP
ncbi:Hypothetical_protein [Hexamita inflata]|uniref:Hypothetical_protein n=1 Tax=Hexamita inflata TaxID=28002 RepID=A0AA86PIM8_9EUKA|nr:Hypothetical protein HINF_LOCUS26637 [Hexamita inflata]